MEILTEADLRSGGYSFSKKITLTDGTFITPLAKDYIHTNGIEVLYSGKAPSSQKKLQTGGSFGHGLMSYSPIKGDGKNKFVDYETGEGYSEKPENMTHLYANVLVTKNHPRIILRGKLDSLEAVIMRTQITAVEAGYRNIADDLDDVMGFVQELLGCEVKNTPVPEYTLLGMGSERLRYVSHHLVEEFGIMHSIPHYSMGRVCAELNYLRTQVRETELAAVCAFENGKKSDRCDIVEALNRLSSCVYIIFCKKVAGQYEQ